MSFFDELKRRNVARVGVAYAVIGWVLAQIAEFASNNFGAPDWVLKIFVVFLLLGLPLALFFAWAFEMTPEGIKREKDVDRSQSITPKTGRKLDFIIIAVMAVGIVFLLADKFIYSEAPGPNTVEADNAKPPVIAEPADAEIIATSQSIAVLPFVNMSDDKDYFADGLSEELLNLLAKIPGLKVAGRTSSFVFKEKTEDLRAIGDALGVTTVLEGSVRRSGDRLRITAQLINVADGFHIWSETYDRNMADIFDIQDDVAGAISTELQLRLAPTSVRPTDSTEAYELYLEVLATSDFPDGDISPGIELLDRAIALDPGFAKAYELKAMLYWFVAGWKLESAIGQGLVYQSATKALELDPTLVGARSFSITATPIDWSWTREVEALEIASDAEPNNLRVLLPLAYDYGQSGYFAESLAIARRMIDIDPLSPDGYVQGAGALSALGRDDEAQQNWRKAAALGDRASEWSIASNLLARGDDEAAIAGFQRAFRGYGLDPSTVRPLIEGARNPDTGKEFLIDFVNEAKANAIDFEAVGSAQTWYLLFAYLDEFWREVEETTARSTSSWSDSDIIEANCRIFAATGCANHPRAIAYAKQQGLMELWDKRGAPDRCNKGSGEWVCE